MKRVILFLALMAFAACRKPAPDAEQMPELKGRLVYHSYSSYEARDSKLFLFDFSTKTRTEISRGWSGLRNPMNGHFSPDGRFIVFMAEGESTNSWDIFLYDVASGEQPVNLTPSGSFRDEDPKFSFDGSRIVFKRDGHLAEMDPEGASVRVLNPSASGEYSMPYYSMDGKVILFSLKDGSETSIGCWNLSKSEMQTLYDRPGIQEYYPVTLDDSSFYYCAHYSSDNPHDQLYKGYLDGKPCTSLAFDEPESDYSDPCPVGDGWLLFSSTRSEGKGAYDLYIGHESSGVVFTLDDFEEINGSLNELGASYSAVRLAS